jgi:hypothetical protein
MIFFSTDLRKFDWCYTELRGLFDFYGPAPGNYQVEYPEKTDDYDRSRQRAVESLDYDQVVAIYEGEPGTLKRGCEDLFVLRRRRALSGESYRAGMGYYCPARSGTNSTIARRVFECDWDKVSAAFGRMRTVPTKERAIGWMWTAYCHFVIQRKFSLVVKMLASSHTAVFPISRRCCYVDPNDLDEGEYHYPSRPRYVAHEDIDTPPGEHPIDAYSITKNGDIIYYKYTADPDREIHYSAFESFPFEQLKGVQPRDGVPKCLLLVWVVPSSLVDKVTSAPIRSWGEFVGAGTGEMQVGEPEQAACCALLIQQCVMGLDYATEHPLKDDIEYDSGRYRYEFSGL